MNAADRLRLLFEEQINVMPIAENLLVFDESNFREEMESRNFHTAVFKKSGQYWKYDVGESGPSPVEAEEIIPQDTPLIKAFRLLIAKRRYFIEEEGQLAYIVTRTDLDKIPVRIGLFGVISILETHMKNLIRNYLPTWESSISANRLNNARDLYEWKKARKEEIDLVQCLQFGDLGSIFSKQQRFKKFDPGLSREGFTDMMNDLGKLRDALAHSQSSLGFSWEEIDQMVGFVRKIIDSPDPVFEG